MIIGEAETIRVNYGDALGQGDIIHIVGSSDPPSLGVIINADCDLANNKTDGVITYLPIYSINEYLQHFWMIDFAEEQRNQIIGNILTICGLDESGRDLLIDWLHDEDNGNVADHLASGSELNRKATERLRAQVEKYIAVFSADLHPRKQFQNLCSYQNNPGDFARKQIRTAYRNLGEGHLFLNEIKGVKELGFIVRMRRIYSLNEKKFFRSNKDYLLSDQREAICGIRNCKLSGVFQFKLAQLFAYQFSRIGLPDEFRDMHSLVLDDTATRLLEEGA